MDGNRLIARLKEFGIYSKAQFLEEAFSRNIGLLTQAEQEKMANAKVGIPGMGGVGGVHLITMVRTGVCRFNIADFDIFEPVNINRQYGARIPHFGASKLEVMKEEALQINPYLEIHEFPDGLKESNIDEFLDGVDVVLDSLDFFEFHIRRLLFNRAREKGIYVITAGPLGFSSAMLIFSPHKGMSFDEYFNITEDMEPKDQYLSYAVGLAPRATHIKYIDPSRVDLESKTGPSLNISCQICSGMAATEAVRIILNKKPIKPVPYYFQFDPYVRKYRSGKLFLGNRNPVQRLKMKVVKSILNEDNQIRPPAEPKRPGIPTRDGKVPEDVIRHIIKAGIQAPSGDNIQPWRFSYVDNKIFLYLNPEADRSFFNIDQIASIISSGAVLENIRIASTVFEYDARIKHRMHQESNRSMACVELIRGNGSRSPLFNSIWERHTNRKPYEKRALEGSILKSFTNVVSEFPGVHLHMITGRNDIKKIAKIIYRADRIRTEHRALHEHLHEMICYRKGEAERNGYGFPLKSLEAGLAGEMFLRISRPWPVMNFFNHFGLGRMVALHSYLGAVNASGLGLLTVDGNAESDFLKGGQALQRLWLTMTQNGISMQPMTAITLFRLRWHLKGEQCFSAKHRKILSDIWPEYEARFSKGGSSGLGHVMLFRFGYAKDTKYRTHRREIETFMR